ncbi:MAG: GIY-YIG nuclease family protein [Verrucomicrobia bacterium]|nr:GIY-YIG nuclease family protein [Verrucomicrobiota bacterium]
MSIRGSTESIRLIESASDRGRHYVGQTGELKARLAQHNAGKSIHPCRYKPWNLVCYLGFADERAARRH